MAQMTTRMQELFARVGAFLSEKGISKKTLNRACFVLFILMLIPLVWIAFYNYPADDDFQNVLGAATAWVQQGSLVEALKAVWAQVMAGYMSWHGVFASGVYTGLTPMIFNMDLYFLSNWCALAMLCLSWGYLIKTLLHWVLDADKNLFWIVYTPVMILVLQFLPSIGDGIYWHTGSGYLFAFDNMLFSIGMLLRANKPQTRARAIWRGCLLAISAVALGGSFYGPMLAALFILFLIVIISFVKKQRNRLHCGIFIGFFLVALIFNVMSPGIALRQQRVGDPLNPVVAVATAILDSFDLAGQWLSPQLFAMLLLIVPVLWKPLQNSSLSFRHPFALFVMLYGMFSATLVPGIYTNFSYGMGRYFNVIYLNFLLMALGSVCYAEGWLIRFLERHKESGAHQKLLDVSRNLGERFVLLYLALSIAFLMMGGFGNTIMNTSSVSAAKSLITGEAAKFKSDMKAREEYIRVTDSDVVAVQPLNSQPYVFKPDKLPFQGIYGRVRYMKWYFELFYNAAHSQEVQQSGGVDPAS